ncbi:hypothetical protein [Streptomyces mirabilis]|uniref:hypothetical protein n=1 Tax=Streptomyces mirabilis TaxID=68239 RepID=UPI00324AD531
MLIVPDVVLEKPHHRRSQGTSSFPEKLSTDIKPVDPGVGAGEVGIDDGFVEVSGDGAVAFDAHDDVEVDEGVADLAGAGHLAGQVVLATRW